MFFNPLLPGQAVQREPVNPSNVLNLGVFPNSECEIEMSAGLSASKNAWLYDMMLKSVDSLRNYNWPPNGRVLNELPVVMALQADAEGIYNELPAEWNNYLDSLQNSDVSQLALAESSVKDSSYTLALGYLDAVTDTNQIIGYYKQTLSYEVMQRDQQADTLSANQVNELKQIAQLCPENFGPGVFQARAMIAYYTGEWLLYEDACDAGQKVSRHTAQQPKKAIEGEAIRIYPNPTQCYVILERTETNPDVAEIFNTNGQKVMERKLNDKEWRITLDMNELPAGIYMLRLLNSGYQSKILLRK